MTNQAMRESRLFHDLLSEGRSEEEAIRIYEALTAAGRSSRTEERSTR